MDLDLFDAFDGTADNEVVAQTTKAAADSGNKRKGAQGDKNESKKPKRAKSPPKEPQVATKITSRPGEVHI